MEIRETPLRDGEMKPLFDNPDDLGFGRVFTDRMFTMEYEQGTGWKNPEVRRYEPFQIDPATLVLHYGQEIFEGMKAFAGPGDEILLFRPKDNVRRFNLSARRMCMPEIDDKDMLEAIVRLVQLEHRWIPRKKGASLYIRPTMIASEVGLGVRPSSEYLFFIILSPVGPYFKEGFKPIQLFVSDTFVRAAPGGVGEAKTGGNYAASLLAQKQAKDLGFKEVLWLNAKERKNVEEVGAMNIFFVIDGVVTTPLLDGAILHGITRKSVLELAKHLGHKTEERNLPIDEVAEGMLSGRVSEAFGSGTAASVAPVGAICYKGTVYHLKRDGEVGPVANQLYQELQAIQYGEKEDPFGWTLRCRRA